MPCSVDTSAQATGDQCVLCRRLEVLPVPAPQFGNSPGSGRSPVAPRPALLPDPSGQADPTARVRWARCPQDGRMHAVDHHDADRTTTRIPAECLCGRRLPAAGLAFEADPSGALCMACVVRVTSDLPGPQPSSIR